MTLARFVLVVGLSSTVITTAGAGANYYLQHEFVTIGALLERDLKRDIRDIKSAIGDLEYDRDHGGLTDKQDWKLRQLRRQLEELQQELGQ